MTAITAVTAQNTTGVKSIVAIKPKEISTAILEKIKVEVKPSDSSSKSAGDKKKAQTNGTSTYGATGNSAAYGAAHTNHRHEARLRTEVQGYSRWMSQRRTGSSS